MDIELGQAAPLALPTVDVAVLSQAARVDALIGLQRVRAWVDALEQRLLVGLAEPGEVPHRFAMSAAIEAKQYVREEIACALQVSPMTVNDKLHTARTLVTDLPATLCALESARITMRHARILVEAVAPLDAAGRNQVEQRVLQKASEQTPTRFRQTVTRAVLQADPRGAEQRYEQARGERAVAFRAQPDGMGSVHAEISAEDMAAVRETIQSAADAHPDHDADCGRAVATSSTTAMPNPTCAGCESRSRTADQRRADAFVSLLCGLDTRTVQTRHGRRPAVQVSVALSTLLGRDDQPGELDGYGPIPADVARRMAGDPSGTWRRLVTDDLGHLVDYGRSTYRPPQDLSDHVIARDRTCRFPGCGQQARNCELDHLIDWDLGGHTDEHNLLASCPRHHHLRHDTDWRVEGDPAGVLTWIAPTGHEYEAPLGGYPFDATAGVDWLDPPPARPPTRQDDADHELDPPPF